MPQRIFQAAQQLEQALQQIQQIAHQLHLQETQNAQQFQRMQMQNSPQAMNQFPMFSTLEQRAAQQLMMIEQLARQLQQQFGSQVGGMAGQQQFGLQAGGMAGQSQQFGPQAASMANQSQQGANFAGSQTVFQPGFAGTNAQQVRQQISQDMNRGQ